MPDEDKILELEAEVDCQYWEEEPVEPEEVLVLKDEDTEADKPRHARKKSSGKGDFRKHGLSTGILVLWLGAVAVLCLAIGGIAGATWQHGNDERAFEVERSAYNDKIATLQSKAEEDQQELAELREFRKELVDLLTEYMIIDVQKQSGANGTDIQDTLDAPGAGGGPEPTKDESAPSSESSPNLLERLLGGNDSSPRSSNAKSE